MTYTEAKVALERIKECLIGEIRSTGRARTDYYLEAIIMATKALDKLSASDQCQKCKHYHADFDGYDAVCALRGHKVEYTDSCTEFIPK